MTDALIKEYKSNGVEFIALSEAAKDEAFKIDPAVIGEHGSEFTYQVMKSRGLKLSDLGMKEYSHFPESELEALCK